MFVSDQLPWKRNVLWKHLKMHGRVDTIFCIPMVIQSRLFSITEII